MSLDSNVPAFAASLLIMFPLIAVLEWQNARHAKRNRTAYNMPQSRKHVRISHRTFDVRIAYYNHGGIKVTTRTVPMARYHAVLHSARAKGYRVI